MFDRAVLALGGSRCGAGGSGDGCPRGLGCLGVRWPAGRGRARGGSRDSGGGRCRCTARIEQYGEFAHALAGIAVHFQQQVEIGIVDCLAAGDPDDFATGTVGHAEMQRDRGAAADNAGSRKFLARSQLDAEILQFRRAAGMQRNFRQQRLPQRRLDLDLTKIQRQDLAGTQGQCHQHRQFQRTIHACSPERSLAQLFMWCRRGGGYCGKRGATLVICSAINNSRGEYLQSIAAVCSHRSGTI